MIKERVLTYDRIGEFIIPYSVLYSDDPIVPKMFSTVKVLEAFGDFASDCVRYRAISKQFDEVRIGDIVPKYRAIWCEGKLSWERIG